MDAPRFFQKRLIELFEDYKGRGHNQKDLAVAAGVKQSQVSTWLKGGYTPGYESLIGLSRAFGVPVASLFPPTEGQAPGLDPELLTALSLIAKQDPSTFEQIQAQVLEHAKELANDRADEA